MGEWSKLGEITCPSGVLVIGDGGHLGIWSGERSPAELDVAGLDVHPARVAEEPETPHAERARQGADGEFAVFGLPMVAVGGLPVDRPLRVDGTRMPDDEYSWESLRLAVSESPAARTVRLGSICVDWARLFFGDVDALSHWEHHDPIDGKADLVFWGRAEEAVAAEFGATRTGIPGEETSWGWVGLGMREAVERGRAIVAWQQANPEHRFKLDFRPHSHHWQVMAQVRATAEEAGVVEVGGARVLFAMTTWGDGFFPVYADYDGDNALVAVRVDFVGD
ncbi:hypothetical protein SAMN05421504_1021146 [Amycolatopsis xylanica]|uniref:DUF4241 domain-containing protein n=1 Tax=Amycolatopsis xylanica TaxID=589385 RepID=A0A1H3B446_9PSEU|nr:hypothetical protein [Amycolatopsis xylanica]SDX35829.1 hypothetical protein SAMN05421504_1021146 [Amycolatopsis xylanica]